MDNDTTQAAGKVLTLSGWIPVDRLGITLPHEHLIAGLDYQERNYPNSPTWSWPNLRRRAVKHWLRSAASAEPATPLLQAAGQPGRHPGGHGDRLLPGWLAVRGRAWDDRGCHDRHHRRRDRRGGGWHRAACWDHRRGRGQPAAHGDRGAVTGGGGQGAADHRRGDHPALRNRNAQTEMIACSTSWWKTAPT